jgi:ribosome-associated translation inhibitor RaiA
MQIQIHTDHHIEGHEAFTAWAAGEIKDALVHHQDQITRVEAHMSDQNGHKGGLDDKRCVLEARLAGRQPMAATHHGDTLYLAVTGAAHKVNRMIEGALGRAARKEAQPD